MTCGSLTLPLELLLAGGTGIVTVPIPSFLIEHPKGTVLFDTGLSTTLRGTEEERRGGLGPLADVATVDLAPGEAVTERLRAAGHDPSRIDFLITSHLHFDHVGGNASIPNARLVVQRREWAAGASLEGREKNHFDQKLYDLGHDRLEVDGEHDLFDDGTVVCVPTYGHTPGHQSLKIRTDDGEVLLTADACYMRRALDELRLPTYVDDRALMLRVFEQFRALEASGVRLIFGHDPILWPQLNNGPLRPITMGKPSAPRAGRERRGQ
jgi:N-acyl homoserine lactone hydrolase